MAWTKAQAKAMRKRYGLGEYATPKRKVRRTKKITRKPSKVTKKPRRRVSVPRYSVPSMFRTP